MSRFTFHIRDVPVPVRLDVYLSRQKNFPSRSRIQALIGEGKILLNHRPTQPSARLKNGDVVTGEFPAGMPVSLEAEPLPLSILYQDEDVVVVDKPAGMVTHPTPSLRTGTLVNALLYHCRDLSGIGGWLKPGIVHRLDKLTSGVMVAAKNDLAHQRLAAQFKAHTVSRKYLALVHGLFKDRAGKLESYIGRNPRHRLKMTGRAEKGRRAVTHYRVLSENCGMSLLECRLETGRTHQVRVHLAEAGHPLVGDALYGKGRSPSSRLTPAQAAALRHLKRQALHAFLLAFDHPRSGERLTFTAPLPPDLRSLLSSLQLLDSILPLEKSPPL